MASRGCKTAVLSWNVSRIMIALWTSPVRTSSSVASAPRRQRLGGLCESLLPGNEVTRDQARYTDPGVVDELGLEVAMWVESESKTQRLDQSRLAALIKNQKDEPSFP